MQEVFRIRNGRQKMEGKNLRDYNLTVYAGEIIFVQGLSGSGILSLIEFLKGKSTLESGEIYIEEERLSEWNEEVAQHCGIHVITGEEDLLGNLTVAENLELFQRKRPFQLYHAKKIEERYREYLKEVHLSLSPGEKLSKLTAQEKQKLSLVKAGMSGAKVIVLDCTKDVFGDQTTDEIGKMILEMKEKNVSFVLIAEKFNDLASIATRVQVIEHGRDRMEWDCYDRDALNRRYPKTTRETEERLFEGIYDYSWDSSRSFFEYCRLVKENHPENERVQKYLLRTEKEEIYYRSEEGTVFIPKDSGFLLQPNMKIRDILAMSVPERTGTGKYGVIHAKLARYISEDFYREFNIPETLVYQEQLSYPEKKLLSIFRWALAKPKCIYLENPYYGLDPLDEEVLRQYLVKLVKQGIRIVYSSKSEQELMENCNVILRTENARNARFIEN